VGGEGRPACRQAGIVNYHIRYIEYNPVKHGYVDDAKECQFILRLIPFDNNIEI